MSGPDSTKKTDPRALALVLAVTLLIAAGVGVRLWANAQRLAVPNIKAMTSAPDGRVLVVLGDTLYVESPTGESLRVMPLSEWGVRSFHGDLAVLDDGAVILARGRLPDVGAGEGGRMILRARPAASDPVDGLMRCELGTSACITLGDEPAAKFRRAFGMDVDRENGLLYVSEPGRHRIVQLSLDGRVLASNEGDWRFPNGTQVLPDGRIGFADTNHFRYVELAAGPEGFGAIAYEKSIAGWPGIIVPLRVPSETVKDTRGNLWLLAADDGMANAWLYRYPENGQPQRLDLPPDADPVWLTEAADGVLVADLQHFCIHRFDLNGLPREDFGSTALKTRLGELRAEHTRFERLFDYSLAGVLLFALPALGAGLYLQHKAQAAHVVEKESEVTAASGLPEFANIETQYASLHGEFIFWRKFTVLGTQESFRFGVLLGGLVLVSLGLGVHAAYLVAERKGVPVNAAFAEGPLPVLLGLVLLAVALGWCSAMFERVIVDRGGIRYRSWLPGRLGHATIFFRPWQLHWNEVRGVKLIHAAKGNNQLMWRYEIVTKDGRKHGIHPLSWRLAGEQETGIRLRDVLRQNPRMIRDVIQRTLLYRLLGQQRPMPAADAMPETA